MEVLLFPYFPAAIVTGCLAAWLTCAVTNNIRDPGTNRHLLGLMVRMELLDDDPEMGNGLRNRAVLNVAFPRLALRCVVAVQVVIAVGLWLAFCALTLSCFGLLDPKSALAIFRGALAAFALLWAVFLCGGMWFGYWIKMGQVQQVHLLLFLISTILFLSLR